LGGAARRRCGHDSGPRCRRAGAADGAVVCPKAACRTGRAPTAAVPGAAALRSAGAAAFPRRWPRAGPAL
jgi:hypothetical protein